MPPLEAPDAVHGLTSVARRVGVAVRTGEHDADLFVELFTADDDGRPLTALPPGGHVSDLFKDLDRDFTEPAVAGRSPVLERFFTGVGAIHDERWG